MTKDRALAWAAVAALAIVALWLRARGVGFGLPAVYNPDEVAIMSRALAFAKGDPNPHNFLYPTLYFYGLFGWIGAFYAVARLVGVYHSAAEFQQSFFLDPTAIYLAGRMLSVVCGVLAVVATERLGARTIGARAGLMGAALLAVSPFAVRDAHYVKHDVPATLATLLAMLAIVRVVQPVAPERHQHVRTLGGVALAGLAVGLASSVHYYLVFLAVPLALAVWWSVPDMRHGLRALSTAAVATLGGFFLGSPFLLLEPLTAVRDIVANRRIVVDRAVEAGGTIFPSAAAYARMLATDAMGWPVAVLAAAGVALLIVAPSSDRSGGTAGDRRRTAILLLSFPVVFVLFVSNTVAATRYLNPVLPFVALFAAAAIDRLSGGTRRSGRAALLTLAAAVPGLMASVEIGTFFRQDDTRTEAARYFAAEVPPGSTVLLQPYSVPLAQSRVGLVEALRHHIGDERQASTKFQLQLALPRWPVPSYRLIWLGSGGLDADKIYVDPGRLGGAAGLDPLRRLGVHYVVLKGYNGVSPAAQPLEAALAREARRVAVFTPYRAGGAGAVPDAAEPFLHNTDTRIVPALERPGPEIYIWKL
jgi:hypothetical protein